MPITLTIVFMIIIYAAIKRHAATKLSCHKHISPIAIDNPMSPLPRSTTTHWSYTIDTWILVAIYVYILPHSFYKKQNQKTSKPIQSLIDVTF